VKRSILTSLLVTIVASSLAVLLSFLWRRLPVDDAYITFRYAANVASGHGLVFNVGDWVLGTTTPLWALVLAGLATLNVGIEHSATIIGAACTVGSSVLFLSTIPTSTVSRVLWALLIALYYPLSVITFSGMETPPYILVVGIGLYCFGTGHPLIGALMSCLATLLRPDGALIMAAGLLGGRRRPHSSTIMALALYAAILGTCVVWSYQTYGSLLPHSVEAKKILYQTAPLQNTLFFLEALSQEPIDALLLCLGASGLILIFKDPTMRPFSMWALLYSVGIIFSGVKPIFFWYFGPLWFLFLTVGLEGIRRRFSEIIPQRIRVLCPLLLLTFIVLDVYKRAPGLDPVEVRENAYRTIAERFNASILPGNSILMSEIGVLGYGLPQARVIDSAGLVSPHVSDIIRESLREKPNGLPIKGTPWLQKIIERDNPDWLIGSKGLTSFDTVENEPWFSKRYELMEVLEPGNLGGVAVFRRR
jgi:hypothetical protein